MALTIYGKVGPQTLTDGADAALRLGRSGEVIVQHAHARYYEAVKRGNCYTGGTAVTGVAPGTSIGTTAAFSMYNPLDSGVDMVILMVAMGYVSGTLGAGVVHYVANSNTAAAATTGTAIAEVNLLVGKAAANACQLLTTATLPVTPTVMHPFCSLQASLASTAVAPWQVIDYVDGKIIIKPGATVSLEATAAAGSTPLVVYSALFEEVPI